MILYDILIGRVFPGNLSCNKVGDGKLVWTFWYVLNLDNLGS